MILETLLPQLEFQSNIEDAVSCGILRKTLTTGNSREKL